MKYKIEKTTDGYIVYIQRYFWSKYKKLYVFGDALVHLWNCLPNTPSKKTFCVTFPSLDIAKQELERFIKLRIEYKLQVKEQKKKNIVEQGKIDSEFKFTSML